MDDERVLRKTKPMLAISTTVAIKRWVEAEALRKRTTQADIVNTLIKDAMEWEELEPRRTLVEVAS